MNQMDDLMQWVREVGATRYVNRHYPDRPTHTFNIEQLTEFAQLVANKAVEADRAVRKSATYTCGVCGVPMQMEATLD